MAGGGGVRRGGFDTRADAERACWEVQQLPGPQAVARTWTVRRWLQCWLSDMQDRVRPTTAVNYRGIVDRYLIPVLGDHRLSKLHTRDVQRALDRICRQQVRGGRLISVGTVARIRAVLGSALADEPTRCRVSARMAFGSAGDLGFRVSSQSVSPGLSLKLVAFL